MKSGKQASAGRNQAKDAIGAVCHILNSNSAITKITPEIFRQAKFDHQEAVPPLWALLGQLLELNLPIPSSQGEHTSNQNRDKIKSFMLQSGYSCPEFYVDTDIGARELLLAVGWLLARTNFLNNQVKTQLLNRSLPSSTSHLHKNQSTRERMVQKEKASKGSSAEDQARLLVWMMGRLRLSIKSLHWEQQAFCSYLHRVHEATQGVSTCPQRLPHLTAWETFLLRHPQHMKQYLEDMERDSSFLQSCLTWRELEPVFWQWMSSVKEAKLSARVDADNMKLPAIPPVIHSDLALGERHPEMEELCRIQASLCRLLEGFESQIQSLPAAGEMMAQIPDHPDTAKRKAEIENIVRTKLTAVGKEHGRSRANVPLRCVRFAYKPAGANKHRGLHNELPPVIVVEVKAEIARLREGVRQLQAELEDLRTEQGERLDDLADRLSGVVSIPPMSEKDDVLLET
ncbi:tubulin epsilon and delta complex protein 1-like [Diadema setosum]|uniref:tubulin epsilon and delta complex protein 1-like n=1 Tax=Diadema setosum TaxID=31175 RepID=UPI003B3A9389